MLRAGVIRASWHSRCDCLFRRRGKSPRTSNECGRAALHRKNCAAIPGRISMSMTHLVAFAKSFARHEEGQDLLEYALLVALIALIAIGAVGMAGTSVKTIFTNISTQLNGAAS
jgi:pilus assembly protein Flp/PilA